MIHALSDIICRNSHQSFIQKSSIIVVIWCSHFWRPRTPCLWPLGTRSWEGLLCLETDRPRQTAHSLHLLQRRSHLRGQNRTEIIFLKIESYFFLCILRLRYLMNGWLACLCVASVSSQRMSWTAGCQQQKASWSCSRSSCHCEEERSSLVSAEHSHT